MALSRSVKDRLVSESKDSVSRGRVLYSRIALNGGYRNGAAFSPLGHPDRRDVAAFIFFEVAAHYEYFCCEALKIEVRKRFLVEPKRAIMIMGSSDKGLSGVMGWASPGTIQTRAQNLLGMTGFFGRLEALVGKSTYDTLTHAHKVRNRIAHSGPKSITDYNKILGQLAVPAGSRKGLSPGRLLMDYPSTANVGDRWFDRFLNAYLAVIDGFDHHVSV